MAEQDSFLQYAEEAMQAARAARTDAEVLMLVELANVWRQADRIAKLNSAARPDSTSLGHQFGSGPS
jgi:hypothetical protein